MHNGSLILTNNLLPRTTSSFNWVIRVKVIRFSNGKGYDFPFCAANAEYRINPALVSGVENTIEIFGLVTSI